MNSFKTFDAQTSAVISGTGRISTYFVKWSVSNRIYRLPRSVRGNGPRQSVPMKSPGAPDLKEPNGALGRTVGFLMDSQTSYFRM